MGAATDADLRMYLTYPRLPVAKRRAALEALLRSGEVLPIAVEGDETRWGAHTIEGDIIVEQKAWGPWQVESGERQETKRTQ